MKIAVDAMGTDNFPRDDIMGGILAAREFGDTIVFVGDEKIISEEIKKHNTSNISYEILHASDHIAMDEKPTIVIKSKPQSSIHVALKAVKDGKADAFVTMGNTGAVHAIATLNTLRRIPGVKRPVLTAIFSVNRHQMIFLDVGANTDVKADWLQQFAIMGSIYAKRVLRRPEPKIAILSNGEEETKGNSAIREAIPMLNATNFINFIGNIEPSELMTDKADVIVMDGFVGNIVLKMFEATARYMAQLIRQEIRNDVVSTLGGLLARPAFNRLRKQVDTSEVGGAPLLGVNGIVIIGHGQSSPVAIKNAINQARLGVQGEVISAIKEGMARIPQQIGELENGTDTQ